MKTYEINISATAEECLFEIFRYIALDSPVNAEKFIDDMLDSLVDTLSILPFGGKVIKRVPFELRSFPYKNYIAFYRVQNEIVEILYIFNSAQNIKRLLRTINFNLL